MQHFPVHALSRSPNPAPPSPPLPSSHPTPFAALRLPPSTLTRLPGHGVHGPRVERLHAAQVHAQACGAPQPQHRIAVLQLVEEVGVVLRQKRIGAGAAGRGAADALAAAGDLDARNTWVARADTYRELHSWHPGLHLGYGPGPTGDGSTCRCAWLLLLQRPPGG